MTEPVAVLIAVGVPGVLLARGSLRADPPRVRRGPADPHCRACGAEARWSSAPTEQSDSCYVCPVDWRHGAVEYRGWEPWSDRGYDPWDYSGDVRGYQFALVLWWDGSLVPEGWDRLRRVLATLPEGRRPTGPLWGWLHDFRPLLSEVVIAAEFAVREGLGARVVLLDRQDGRLVERQP